MICKPVGTTSLNGAMLVVVVQWWRVVFWDEGKFYLPHWMFEGEVCVLPILVWGDVLPPIICLSLSGIRDRHSLLVCDACYFICLLCFSLSRSFSPAI